MDDLLPVGMRKGNEDMLEVKEVSGTPSKFQVSDGMYARVLSFAELVGFLRDANALVARYSRSQKYDPEVNK